MATTSEVQRTGAAATKVAKLQRLARVETTTTVKTKRVWLSITDDSGVLFERIDITDTDLSRPLARADLVRDIIDARLAAADEAEGR